jgi:hypothetical protein
MVLIDTPAEDAVRFGLLRVRARPLARNPGLAPAARALAGRRAGRVGRTAEERGAGPTNALDAEAGRPLARLAAPRLPPPWR